jgi:3-hydroxyisobutyrate dehydrogenase
MNSPHPSPAAPPDGRIAGLVGLGNLGAPMARRLLDAGWTVRVYDRYSERVAACAALGAQPAETVLDLAPCAVLGVVVNDDAAVQEVLAGSGLLDRLAPAAAIAVHSTVLPATAVTLGELAAKAGVALVDAPVSGGAERARSGDLTVFLGAPAEGVPQPLTDYLRTVASRVVRVGYVGAGAAAKLGNQLMMFASVAAAYEATELALAYGADETAFLDAASTSTGDSWILHNRGFFDRTAADYDAAKLAVRQRPWSKDLWDVVAAARDRDLAVPVAGLLAQLMADRIETHAAAAREAAP